MNQRVLVCEDHRAIRLLLGKVLTRRGLVDLAMPAMSGYEAVDVLQREHLAQLDTPIQQSFRGRPWTVATTNEGMPKESSGDGWYCEQMPGSRRRG